VFHPAFRTPRSALLFSLLLLSFAAPAQARVRLPSLFGTGMVLQRDRPIAVWGRAEPGEDVTVELAGGAASATAGPDGRWRVALPPLPAGGPHVLRVNELRVPDVLVGEVWLCAGQSNMHMTLSMCLPPGSPKPAYDRPRLRMFTVEKAGAAAPREDARGSWRAARGPAVGDFSAMALFFGEKLEAELDVPVGLIDASLGGTPIESYTELAAQRENPLLSGWVRRWEKLVAAYTPEAARKSHEKYMAGWRDERKKCKDGGCYIRHPRKVEEDLRVNHEHPAALFHGMISPLMPFTLRGVLWYQGEKNAMLVHADQYEARLRLLIESWRRAWGDPSLFFVLVQIPGWQGYRPDAAAWVRDAQRRVLDEPRTALVVTADVQITTDIHDPDKRPVADRAALAALGAVYGRPGESAGPLPREAVLQGPVVRVRFEHADGLVLGDVAEGDFELTDENRWWLPAQSRVEGGDLLLFSTATARPTGARYGWKSMPNLSLFNGAGLPATPFLIDVSTAAAR
jgi:sialate O-acetylesterase